MKAALRVVGGKSPKPKLKTLKEIEEAFESNTGFDPEDPPQSLESGSEQNQGGVPWDASLQSDHRRSFTARLLFN